MYSTLRDNNLHKKEHTNVMWINNSQWDGKY